MLAACGIEEFILPLPVDTASVACKIKSEPEDFVVVEVDPTGQRTDAADYTFPVPSVDTAPSDGCGLLENATDSTVNNLETDGAADTTVPLDLVQLLSSQDMNILQSLGNANDVAERALTLSGADLQALVQHIRGVPSPCGAHEGASCWWLASYSLGSFPDKQARWLVHMGIRSRFFHIRSRGRTVSSPSPGEPVQEVYAMIDPHYVFFTFLFGPDVAEVLAQWATRHARCDMGNATPIQLSQLAAADEYVRQVCGRTSSTASGNTLLTTFREELVTDDISSDQQNNEVPLSAKVLRRTFHEMLRRYYPFIKCHVREGRVTMRLLLTGSTRRDSQVAGVRRARDDNTLSEHCTAGCYTHLIIRKRNLDTAELKVLLGKHFGVRDGFVCCAGMKDKRGVTYQRCSIPGVCTDVKDTAAKSPCPVTLHWPGDSNHSLVEIVRRSPLPLKEPVQLGQLRGNHFTLILRDLHWTEPSRASPGIALRPFVEERFWSVCAKGIINYFGQQRFSETITEVHDHTGVYLFAGRWCQAVRSLYRSCPAVYESFPEKMEPRFVPNGCRDAYVMTQSLHHVYRVYFSTVVLSQEDVLSNSLLWERICEKAITDAVPYTLRAMWVHAAQSLAFNVTASFIVRRLQTCDGGEADGSPFMHLLRLPLGGYQVPDNLKDANVGTGIRDLVAEAHSHMMRRLQLTEEQLFRQRKVAGVPIPGSLRQLFVKPTEASLEWVSELNAKMSFFLPSSSYATILIREVLGTQEWF